MVKMAVAQVRAEQDAGSVPSFEPIDDFVAEVAGWTLPRRAAFTPSADERAAAPRRRARRCLLRRRAARRAAMIFAPSDTTRYGRWYRRVR